MKFWKKLWAASPPAQASDVEVEPDPLRASQEGGTHFLAFVELLTACVAQDEAQRILRVAHAAWRARAAEDAAAGSFAPIDAYQVLEEVMAGKDGQRPGQWLAIHLDWKATDEIGWQVADILAQRKVPPTWDGVDQEFDTVAAAFADLAQWLRQRGLALLDIETGADAFCAFIVHETQVARARQLAQAARLTLYDAEEFAARH